MISATRTRCWCAVKGRKERQMILGEYAQAAIRTWLSVRAKLMEKMKLETSALLFSVGPHRSVERLEVRTIGRIVKAVAEAKGFSAEKWHPHLLRICCKTEHSWLMPDGPQCCWLRVRWYSLMLSASISQSFLSPKGC